MSNVVALRRPATQGLSGPLRWLAGDVYWLAHRRDLDTLRPVCGAAGDLILAALSVPLCRECFPGDTL